MFIQEKKIVLDIGLTKPYKLIHFSDVHVITYNEFDEIEVKQKAINNQNAWMKVRVDFANHFNEPYNQEHLIESALCLDKLIEFTNNNNPDGVLLTGDIIDYYSKANYEYLEKSLANLKSPYLFSCGNHETPSSLYDNLCNGNGLISYIDFKEFIVISLDDSKKKVTQEQLDKINELLTYNKPVIISMHIPIMSKHNEIEMKQYDSYFVINQFDTDEITAKFIDLLINNPLIKAIFCGHVHGASLSYFAPNKPQYCASSGLIGYVNNITIK